jgi:hypothetical protein
MPGAMEVWLPRARSWWRVVLAFLLTLGSVTPGRFASAGDLDADTEISKSLDETSSSRRSWEQHVREEKRRIQELATQRRMNRSHDPVVPPFEEDRLVSERALNDMTLERGDIVVTDKGAFVFRGQTLEDRKAEDFEPLPGFSFRR